MYSFCLYLFENPSGRCQWMTPEKVLMGRVKVLLMYLLSADSFSSSRLCFDLVLFWRQYPGSTHGVISMLKCKEFRVRHHMNKNEQCLHIKLSHLVWWVWMQISPLNIRENPAGVFVETYGERSFLQRLDLKVMCSYGRDLMIDIWNVNGWTK